MFNVYVNEKKCPKTDVFLLLVRFMLRLPLIMTILNVIFVVKSIHTPATEAK